MSFLNNFVEIYAWPVVFIILLISFFTFTLLVIRRLIKDKFNKPIRQRKEELKKLLIISLNIPATDIKDLLLKSKNDLSLIAEISPALLRNINGSSHQQLLNNLEKLGLQEWGLCELSSNSKKRRIASINLLANWSNSTITKRITLLLSDPNPLVRTIAIDSLARIGDQESLAIIIDEFIGKTETSIPLMTSTFQKFGRKINTKLLFYIKEKNTPTRIKISAMMALIHSNETEKIIDAAESLYISDDNNLKNISYYAFSQSGIELSRKKLELGINDNDWRIREHVVNCITNITPLPVDLLNILLKDRNSVVAYQSGKVIFESGQTGKNLLKMLSEKESLVAKRAKMILAENDTHYGMV